MTEPGFSEVAAKLCQELRSRGDTRDHSNMDMVDFRMMLIQKCNGEFYNYKHSFETRDEFNYMAAAQNYHQAKVLYDQEEMRLRRRKLNFFRFIGELYKLPLRYPRIGAINVGIMHEYIQKLSGDKGRVRCGMPLQTSQQQR